MTTGWKKICCAIDFSEPSRSALWEASRLARDLGAELTLVYVNEPLPTEAAELLDAQARVVERAAREAEEKLVVWCREAEALVGSPVKSALLAGRAAPEITAFARRSASDLLVISTHGRTGLKHLLMGSVAEEIVRSARRPVLVVPAPET